MHNHSDGGFFITCEDLGKTFNKLFCACAFLSVDQLTLADASLQARISPQDFSSLMSVHCDHSGGVSVVLHQTPQ